MTPSRKVWRHRHSSHQQLQAFPLGWGGHTFTTLKNFLSLSLRFPDNFCSHGAPCNAWLSHPACPVSSPVSSPVSAPSHCDRAAGKRFTNCPEFVTKDLQSLLSHGVPHNVPLSIVLPQNKFIAASAEYLTLVFFLGTFSCNLKPLPHASHLEGTWNSYSHLGEHYLAFYTINFDCSKLELEYQRTLTTWWNIEICCHCALNSEVMDLLSILSFLKGKCFSPWENLQN